ncbi:MAG: chemotaxis protein CheD [Planctomycetota bacterium]|nr:MAG: chemotaxis protein CheD [Planctomycetota bacterium]
MKFVNIGIGEYAVTNDAEMELRTYALGSCVALIIFDARSKVAGLAHLALPDSKLGTEDHNKLPCYYVDTGVKHLVNEVIESGGNPNKKLLTVKLVGGISPMKSAIGKRNVLKVRQVLWQLGMGCHAEDVGGDTIRTVFFNMENLALKVKSPNGEKWEI